jgi:hypothetical protein
MALNSIAQTFDSLETSVIKARVNTGGILFNNIAAGTAAFEAPKNSGKKTMNTSGFWIGGEDASSTLHLAAGIGDFNYGPLVPGLATASTTASTWNRLWKLTAADISYHIANYSTTGYIPITAIAEWPGYGNPALTATSNVTPFFDNDLNGMYDPMAGDYPLIKGTTAIYQIYNDDTTHASGGGKLGVEIHCMTYVFDCASDSALANTVFLNYRIVNQSTQTYYNTYMGFSANMDLGYSADDYTAWIFRVACFILTMATLWTGLQHQVTIHSYQCRELLF